MNNYVLVIDPKRDALILSIMKEARDRGIHHRSGAIVVEVFPAVNRIMNYDKHEMKESNRYVEERLWGLGTRWPLYSGVLWHPVPHPEYENPIEAYLAAYQPDGKGLWDKSTEYGRNHYALLDFLIEELEKSLQ